MGNITDSIGCICSVDQETNDAGEAMRQSTKRRPNKKQIDESILRMHLVGAKRNTSSNSSALYLTLTDSVDKINADYQINRSVVVKSSISNTKPKKGILTRHSIDLDTTYLDFD